MLDVFVDLLPHAVEVEGLADPSMLRLEGHRGELAAGGDVLRHLGVTIREWPWSRTVRVRAWPHGRSGPVHGQGSTPVARSVSARSGSAIPIIAAR
jgi:hypothetical protein